MKYMPTSGIYEYLDSYKDDKPTLEKLNIQNPEEFAKGIDVLKVLIQKAPPYVYKGKPFVSIDWLYDAVDSYENLCKKDGLTDRAYGVIIGRGLINFSLIHGKTIEPEEENKER